ncbi:DUF4382 domain-containing protein [Ferrimonas sediminicola]|uniref:DUF4382 domain-containing protein n=1 Tax=Ferrimonas sediminicola TaxID=2569538 RepID=A0A4U1BCY3_9GAMM|nr:DUF4382 domain-containing protein [Ferrimonas sediminicola]TKB48862.1 DUF4382 domain-containing protein [Ferrimonas sediminicola]
MKKYSFILLPLLAACGGSGDSTPLNQPDPKPEGVVSIAISDAPVDNVSSVVLQLSSIDLTLRYQGGYGEVVNIDLSDQEVDLLQYQGDAAAWLIEEQSIPAGEYMAHLNVVDGSGDIGSYVEDGNGKHPLDIIQPHLPLGAITVLEGEAASFTLDVELRNALLFDEVNGYSLDIRGMRWVDNRYMGHLNGLVDQALIDACEADHADLARQDGSFTHVAYLYPTGSAIEAMDDMALEAEAGKLLPTATAPILQMYNGDWRFQMGYLPEGEYQLGYTCLGHLDQPDTNEGIGSNFEIYDDGGAITIIRGSNGGYNNNCQMGQGGRRGGGRG